MPIQANQVQVNNANVIVKEELWKLPRRTKITDQGRRIIGKDPDVTDSTLKRLIAVERDEYISEEMFEQILIKTSEEIYISQFVDRNEIGTAHLAQCVGEDLGQTMADLICRYCEDRNLPFVIGAYYIHAYMCNADLFYFKYDDERCSYRKEKWSPQKVFVKVSTSVLPTVALSESKENSNETEESETNSKPILLKDMTNGLQITKNRN